MQAPAAETVDGLGRSVVHVTRCKAVFLRGGVLSVGVFLSLRNR